MIILIASPAPRGCQEPSTVIAHELIHSMRRGVDIGKGDHGHAASGLFETFGGNGKLDAETLNKICEVAECTTFNPEE